MLHLHLSRPLAHALTIAVILLVVIPTSLSFGLGEESVGNDPLNANNYTDWPGLIHVINHKARVYRQWVNGNENFFFKGDTNALNKALQDFAKTTAKVKEVVIRPGPVQAKTFGPEHFDYDWDVQIMGGIAGAMIREEGGALVWPKEPRLSVYIGKNIKLDQIKIPKGVTVVELKTLKERITNGLKSKSQHVRGWGCGQLARLDPYDTQTMKTVAEQLKDDNSWVCLNAVGTLATYGRLAKPYLPALKVMAANENDRMKNAIAKTITAIEQGADMTKEAAAHKKIAEAISKKFTVKEK